jgi:hypothetical protein
MGLQVIGAGVGRTGTTSLKVALERLLGGRCYHMYEVFQHPEHLDVWRSAVDGRLPDWRLVFDGYTATVDWPGAAFWRPLRARHPDALVLLSTRESAEAWFESAEPTIGVALTRPPTPETAAWHDMAVRLVQSTFTAVPFERTAAMRAYEDHNQRVRAEVPSARLLDWQPGDGWEPLCERLGIAVPDEPFPHLNTQDDYLRVLARAEPGAPR